MSEEAEGEIEEEKPPNVENFVEYFPWAVGQVSHIGVNVLMNKMIEDQLISSNLYKVRYKKDMNVKSHLMSKSKSKFKVESASCQEPEKEAPAITINVGYNRSGHLVSLKFDKGMIIPRGMVVVLGLIIQFHPYLISINFVRNADQYVIYELSKVVKISNITEVCLDGCFVKEGNFYLLLTGNCNLKILSLARCSITDSVLENLASRLEFPEPASQTLNILNLASNRISDRGAASIATALRLNRHLYHLNLSDNSITDDGAFDIFNIMLEFPATEDELIDVHQLRYEYLKRKHKIINEMVTRVSTENAGALEMFDNGGTYSNSKGSKRRKRVMLSLAKSKMRHDSLIENINVATVKANTLLGKLDHPFEIFRDGVFYCTGNNTLNSLNLAYNSLSYLSLKKLMKVLNYQKNLDRTPRGLVNVSLEGNRLPITCEEYKEINSLLWQAVKAQTPKKRGTKLKQSRSNLTERASSSSRLV